MSLPEEEEDYESAFSLDDIPGVDESIDDVEGSEHTDVAEEVGNYDPSLHSSIQVNIQKINSIGGLVFIYIFTLVWCGITSVLAGGIVLGAIHGAEVEENWARHPGIIIDSGVSENYDGDGGTYCPWIEYQYTIENVTYTNNQIRFDSWETCTSEYYDWADDYPPGENITVYVNPDDPSESIIDTSVDAWPTLLLIPFILVGCFLLWKCATSTYNAIYHPEKFYEEMSDLYDDDDY